MKIQTAGELVKEAKAGIENLTAAEVKQEIETGHVVLIDIRESNELAETGMISGSVHAPRGMLEFYADPAFPYYKPEFNKEDRIILHCASGGRSALAVKTLQSMGYSNVAHLDGGLKVWKEAGFPVIGK